MKLLEYEAKQIFKNHNIPIPLGYVACSTIEVKDAAKKIGAPVVIKAQIPTGGRGKAGGIVLANTPEEAVEKADRILGERLKGFKVRKVLVERRLNIEDELYLGVVVDRKNRSYSVLGSSEGGVDIEEMAENNPEKIFMYNVTPPQKLKPYQARLIAKQMGCSGHDMLSVSKIIANLYELAYEKDAELTEINPLAKTPEGYLAADARLNIDSNALFRHKDFSKGLKERETLELSSREMQARELDLIYVELEGNIGVIGNGAGLTMATVDAITMHGGKPANFLDLGGGASPDKIKTAVSFLLSDPKVEALLVNILGGITRCDETAIGIIQALDQTESVKPIVTRMMGTNEEEGKHLLKEAGIDTLDAMEEAAEKVVHMVRGG